MSTDNIKNLYERYAAIADAKDKAGEVSILSTYGLYTAKFSEFNFEPSTFDLVMPS